MVDSEQKFDAAVQLIRALPKSGSFQPSHEMMLKFYGYYKQAKEGPCKEAKPSFWDVVKKAKWEAWSKLGNISKEDAMKNYVNQLKEVIEKMPETDQVSQFVESLEPFYKTAYENEEDAPPIFNIFRTRNGERQVHKMNGHIHLVNSNREDDSMSHENNSTQNGILNGDILNRSKASLLHNIDCDHIPERNHNHDDTSVANVIGNEDMNCDGKHEIRRAGGYHNSENHPRLSGSKDIDDDNVGEIHDNDSKDNGDQDDDDDDDDDLFCDSLGPELLEQQVKKKGMFYSGDLEGIQENVVNIGENGRGNHHSSLSDVEIIEHFGTMNGVDNGHESSTPQLEKITHVHFDDLSSSPEDQSTSKNVENLSKIETDKGCMVQPNQLGGGGGGGDERELLRGTSGRKQAQRNVPQQSDRPSRYGHRYQRRSQESDSDESPGRSDHNSSSERDDLVIDKIADLLIDIQDNMKKILERLKRVENSLQRSQTSWFEGYKPSKTVVFLIIWPFIVNIIFRFLQKRYVNFRKR